MIEIKDQFLRRAASGLKELSARIKTAGRVGEGLSKEAFRLLHTIKGTAQTFGLGQAAAFAHDLEDHLSSSTDGETLDRGFSHLISLLESDDRLSGFEGLSTRDKEASGAVFVSRISPETFSQFSDLERKNLFSAKARGLAVACFEAGFDLPTFTNDFKALKEKLDVAGETIAALPGENRDGKIFFRFYIAAPDDAVKELAREVGCGVTGLDPPADGGGIYSILSRIGSHVLDLAERSGKEIYVVISVGEITPPPRPETIFDVLLHLVRNAVDHAFSLRGTIYIDLCIKDKGLFITVRDDGRGLDADLIRSKAAEKGLIGPDAVLSREEIYSVIFSPGFSTSETVNDISGRGVGLDAVKSIIAEAGGRISVTGEKEKGTVFEIYLPG